MQLDGANVVVTGGARGIGAALVRRFHAAGANVVVADVLDASPVAEPLGRAVAVHADVSTEAGNVALIDAAVHLGFPRHIAHDLVIETLEGSTLFAKQSGMHPAELRNMVTSPGGTSAAALHELESRRLRTVLSEAVWAAFRRTVELGDQLEASLDVPAKDGPRAR